MPNKQDPSALTGPLFPDRKGLLAATEIEVRPNGEVEFILPNGTHVDTPYTSPSRAKIQERLVYDALAHLGLAE